MPHHVENKPTVGLAALTPRQLEIARRYANGESTREIADAIGLTSGGVGTHRERILNRLGVPHHRLLMSIPELVAAPPGCNACNVSGETA